MNAAVIGDMQMYMDEPPQAVSPVVMKAIRIVEGILIGALKAEGLDNIVNCEQGIEVIALDIEAVVKDFEHRTRASVLDGMKKLA